MTVSTLNFGHHPAMTQKRGTYTETESISWSYSFVHEKYI